MKLKAVVYKSLLGDWVFYCPIHNEKTWCENWLDAMQVAAGHACFWHPVLEPPC